MTSFLHLAQLAEDLAATSSRLKKRAAIATAIAAIHSADPASDDAALFALYLAGTPFAEANPRKLNAGGALLNKAVLAVSGATDAALTAAYRHHGDLGAATFDLLATQPEKPVTLILTELAEAFAAMAIARTTAIRASLVEGLLRRATPLEAKYLIKLMLGDMRIGVKQSLVEEAIAVAASTSASPISPAQVRHAVMLEADLGSAVHRAFAGTLGEARMRLFHPLGFMLASPVDSPEEAIARFTAKAPQKVSEEKEILPESQSEDTDPIRVHPSSSVVDFASPLSPVSAFLEDKYDGMRAQVHCGDPDEPGRVAIYSRNREDVTESFPELAEAFAHVDPAIAGPLIFDGEILGWDFALTRRRPGALSIATSSRWVGYGRA